MLKHVKGLFASLMTAGIVIFGAGAAMAFGHYVPGSLGINAGSMPPPGFHYTMYNTLYNADTMTDSSGNDLDVGLDLTVFANVNQFAYMTDIKILGADYGFDLFLPFVYTNFELTSAGVNEDTFGLGDICVDPLILGWHGKQWDFSFALGAYAPTGESGEFSSPGKGYWSVIETIGGTYFFDEARTWSITLLTRWLLNTEDRDTNITPGAEMVAEYGLAKAFPLNNGGMVFYAGIVGYTYKQLTDDSGDGATDDQYMGNAVGPEVRLMFFKPFPIQVSLRYNFEYGTENTTEGQNVCLSLIGSF
ncbi:MAG: transporter [Deltaproteobacteria bacterium]|nr:transporter [Deltaproteobacteria bacterium]